jgi:SAM-dependent methyltransferase
MTNAETRSTWEQAARGWAHWQPQIAAWMQPATEAMIAMAKIARDDRVLDVASGAGAQTLHAARTVGPDGSVLATDISETMLQHLVENASAAGQAQIRTRVGAAEDLDLDADQFDAAICQLGLMLFADPKKAIAAVERALRPGGRFAAIVFTSAAANPFLALPMTILLRHAGKKPPGPGSPGLFALGGPGMLRGMFEDAGLVQIEERTVAVPLRLGSSNEALAMMQDAFGAYRAVVSDSTEEVRAAAWQEVARAIATFDTPDGFFAPGEVVVVSASAPLPRRTQ